MSALLERLETSGGIDACWPFMGPRDKDGYGRLTAGKGAHRVMFEMAHGFLPEVVMHECDNPPCCNPLHLTAGTHAKNARQRDQRNRGVVGERHPNSRLTIEQVREIRSRLDGESQRELALAFGVSQKLVFKIAHGLAWPERAMREAS